MKKTLIIAGLAAILSISSYVPSVAYERVSIKVTGANSMWGRIRCLALLYMKSHPQVDIAVSGNSPDEGIKALISGETDVAMASRKITVREREDAKARGVIIKEILIGYGGIFIITDKQNNVDELSVDQVRKIFTGRIVNWQDINGQDHGIIVFKSGDKDCGTSRFVEDELLCGVPITKAAVTLPAFSTIISQVARTEGSIAYVRPRDPFPGPAVRIKVLKIRKDENSPTVSPTDATIGDGTYPLRRSHYLYTTAGAGKEVRDFVDFAASKGFKNKPDPSMAMESTQLYGVTDE